jgi:hypothetical protein
VTDVASLLRGELATGLAIVDDGAAHSRVLLVVEAAGAPHEIRRARYDIFRCAKSDRTGAAREVSHNVAWEKRARGGLYYTRSRRVGGRVVREYIGTGEVAELAAVLDARDRAHRESRAATWRIQYEQLARTEAALGELCELGEAVARANLLRAGYRRHHRGEWRRRRVD